MDLQKLKSRISETISKYKYVCIVLMVGIILMMIPGKEVSTSPKEKGTNIPIEEDSMQLQLEEILSEIKGAGNVKVMLSVAQSERTIYQTDSTQTQSENHTDSRVETVLVTDNQRNETGLIQQQFSPIYKGAIILADGGNLASVKLSIVDAVSDVTGLGADKITVLKME